MAMRRQQSRLKVREKRKKRNERTENFMRRLRGKSRRFHVRRQRDVVFVVVLFVVVVLDLTTHKAFRARRFGQGRRAKSKSQSIRLVVHALSMRRHIASSSLSLSLLKANRDDIRALSLSLSLSLSSRRARYTSTLSLSPRATLDRDYSLFLLLAFFAVAHRETVKRYEHKTHTQ